MYVRQHNEAKEEFQILDPAMTDGMKWSIYIIVTLLVILLFYLLWSKYQHKRVVLSPSYAY